MESLVELHPSGREIRVRDGEAILDAAIRSGLNLPHSCKGGSCLVCVGQILEGEAYYPNGMPAVMTEADATAGRLLLCCASVRGPRARIDVPEVLPVDACGIRRLPARVARLEKLAHDVMAVFLRPPPVDPLVFLAGQYIDVLLTGGRRRGFSLACPPHDARLLELHVRAVPGGEFSTRVFGSLALGELLEIEGPLGSFFVREDSDRPILMLGGGTGYAPLKAMLRHAFHSKVTRPIHLYWGVRSEEDLYDADQLDKWAGERPGFGWSPVLSAPLAGWQGCRGYVHDTMLRECADLSAYDVYASGPPPMIDAILATFPAHGLPADRLFVDSFEFATDVLAAIRDCAP